MNATFDLATVQALVNFALDERAAGGFIRCFVVGQPSERAGLYGGLNPDSQPKAQLVAAEIHSAITLDWAASGKKEPRLYQVSIQCRDNTSHTERRFAFAPEEIRAEDATAVAVKTGIAALEAAGAAMAVPWTRMGSIIDHQDAIITTQKDEIAALRARVQELEANRRGAVDELVGLLRSESEGNLRAAQAAAVTKEADAKAAMYTGIQQAALTNAPTLLQLGARILDLKIGRQAPPPGLARAAAGLASAAPEIARAVGLGAPPSPAPPAAPVPAPTVETLSDLSAEAVQALRAFGSSLSDAELSRLVRWAYLSDVPDPARSAIGRALALLEPASKGSAIRLLPLLPDDWKRD